MKEIIWMGSSKKEVNSFPTSAKRRIGYELFNIQCGENPSDWKPLHGIGHGVKEIRIHLENEYRVIYVATFKNAVYVLHAFVKKSQKTAKNNIDTARLRYREIQIQQEEFCHEKIK